jgi:hypothetical protein
VPLSRWLGREPRTVTRYERDDDGLLVAAITEREPEWLDDDRDQVLALLAEQAETCPGCGRPLDECRDPETARTWRVVDDLCHACMALDIDRHNEAERKRPRFGRYVAAVRN